MKKIILIAILWLQVFTIPSLLAGEKLRVVATLFPVYGMADYIGGNDAMVTMLLPAGSDPHDFNPTPKDLADLRRADVFIYVNPQMETWHKKITGQLQSTSIIDASKNIKLRINPHEDHDDHDDEHDDDHGDDHDGGQLDPHIWLSMTHAKKMVDNITGGFIRADKTNAKNYKRRAKEYKKQLTAIRKSYKKTIATCQSKTIIYGGHYAFGYLAHDYGLQYHSVVGFNHDAEPTLQDIKTAIDRINNNNIKYIFYEKSGNQKIAKLLAKETSAKLLPLSSGDIVSKSDMKNNINFFTIMKRNLSNLAIGLSCKKL